MSDTKEVEVAAQPSTPMTQQPDTVALRSYFPSLPATDELNRMWGFALAIKDAAFLPTHARGNTATTFFIIATAQDLGLKWTHALRGGLYPTPGGKLGMEGQVMLALLLTRGFRVKFPKNSNTEASCHITRPDGSMELEEEFTMEDARRIQIYEKDEEGTGAPKSKKALAEKFNYKNFPRNMLKWRALANCARFVAADVLGGIYLPDELEDIEAQESALKRDSGVDPSGQGHRDEFVAKAKETATRTDADRKADAKVVTDTIKAASEEGPTTTEVKSSAAPETTAAAYEVWYEQDGKPFRATDEPVQDSANSALLRAQALVNETKQRHGVKNPDGTMIWLDPPAAKNGETKTETKAEKAAESVNPIKADLIKRHEALVPLLGIAPKTASSRFNAFFVGYMGLETAKSLPRDPALYLEPTEELEATIRSDAKVFNSDPLGEGKRLGVRAKLIREYMVSLAWPDQLQDLAMKVVRTRGFEMQDFQSTVSILQLDKMSPADVLAYYRVLLVHQDSAAKLIRMYKDHNVSPASALAQIENRALGRTVENSVPDQVHNAVLAYSRAVLDEIQRRKEEAAEVAKNKGTTPAPPAEDESEEVGPFGTLF